MLRTASQGGFCTCTIALAIKQANAKNLRRNVFLHDNLVQNPLHI